MACPICNRDHLIGDPCHPDDLPPHLTFTDDFHLTKTRRFLSQIRNLFHTAPKKANNSRINEQKATDRQ
jgi:hypothetical protein